jgi:hypothetical protein
MLHNTIRPSTHAPLMDLDHHFPGPSCEQRSQLTSTLIQTIRSALGADPPGDYREAFKLPAFRPKSLFGTSHFVESVGDVESAQVGREKLWRKRDLLIHISIYPYIDNSTGDCEVITFEAHSPDIFSSSNLVRPTG